MCTTLTFCDFIYATPETVFMAPFNSTFQSPEGISTIRFAEVIGVRKANEMLLLDKKLNAKEAL
jgi:enoyl-CoA hydratase/carnithine racemase